MPKHNHKTAIVCYPNDRVRESIILNINCFTDQIKLVEETAHIEECHEQIRNHNPDLFIVGFSIRTTNQREVIQSFKEGFPHLSIAVLSFDYQLELGKTSSIKGADIHKQLDCDFELFVHELLEIKSS